MANDPTDSGFEIPEDLAANELLFCLPTKDLVEFAQFCGVRLGKSLATELLYSVEASLILREHCETDPDVQQLVAYIVIRDNTGRCLHYRRGKAGAESRLHDKRSLGFGGHINGVDALEALDPYLAERLVDVYRKNPQKLPFSTDDPDFDSKVLKWSLGDALLMTAAYRELEEELGIWPPDDAELLPAGLLRFPADPVSAVHTGVLYHLSLTEPFEDFLPKLNPAVLEGIQDLQFSSTAELKPRKDEFEIWSQLLLM